MLKMLLAKHQYDYSEILKERKKKKEEKKVHHNILTIIIK